MKKVISISFLMLLAFFVKGQTTEAEKTLKTQTADTTAGWSYGGTINTTLAQVSLTNWAAGGQNSISVNGLLSLFARYKKDNMLWENYLDLAYGTVKQGEKGDWMKSDDKFDFTSKYGHCLLYTSPSPRDRTRPRMPSSA